MEWNNSLILGGLIATTSIRYLEPKVNFIIFDSLSLFFFDIKTSNLIKGFPKV